MKHPASRDSIFSERAEILTHDSCPADQYILRLHAPLTASHARPGSFVHLQCDNDLQMRRPMSIMRANADAGWIDILYKVHGLGTGKLTQRSPGKFLEVLGPIGKPFRLEGYRKLPLLLGGGVGIPPMVYLAEHMKQYMPGIRPLVIMGSEVRFPFKTKPSHIMIDGITADTIATMPLLEDWKIPCRLTSGNDFAGCFQGYVTDLARQWLDNLDSSHLSDVELFACGPTPMLRAVSYLAQEYRLPCQISVEEYMACAVGGCAGCTVEIRTEHGPAMKRVCVDGPVFEAASVFPLAV